MNPLHFISPIVATLAQLLPVFAVAPAWNRVTDARRWVAIWSFIFFLSDIAQIAASRMKYNNQWIYKYTNPIEDGVLLWLLAYWQVTTFARITYRVAIPIFIAAYLSIAIGFQETSSFQVFAGPFRAIVILAATLFTLVSRAAHEPEGALQRDWLWTTIGVSIYYAVFAAFEPISAVVAASSREMLLYIFHVKAALSTIAFILIWRGMRCPLPNGYSGST